MRTLVVALVAVGLASCGASHKKPYDLAIGHGDPEYVDINGGRPWWKGLFVRVEKHSGRNTWLILEGHDGGVVSRIDNVDPDGEGEYLATADGELIAVPVVEHGEHLKQLYFRQMVASYPLRQPFVVASPPLREVVFHDQNPMVVVGVFEGEKLWWPLDGKGQLVPLPPGVAGAFYVRKPDEGINREFSMWVVRWEKPIAGWSISREPNANDVIKQVPRWIKKEKIDIVNFSHGEAEGFVGTLPDGSCEVVETGRKRGMRGPASVHSPDCAMAAAAYRKALMDIMEADSSAHRAEIEAENKKIEEQQRREDERMREVYADLLAAQAIEDKRLADLLARVKEELARSTTMSDQLCALVTSLPIDTHADLVAQRKRLGLIDGEQSCLSARLSQYATDDSGSYESSGPSGPTQAERAYADEQKRLDEKQRAINMYNQGNSTICPYGAYLCH